MMYDWQFEEAEREFDRAIKLNPSYATAHHWSAIIPAVFERHDDAVALLAQAVEIDPLSRIINTEYAYFLGLADRFQESEAQFEQARNLDSGFPHLYLRQGASLTLQGRYEEAVVALEKGVELLGSVYGLGALGHAYAKAGRSDEARTILSQLEELSTQRYVSPANVAFVYSGLGEFDRCFELLEKAFEDRIALPLVGVQFDPDLGNDPRFEDLKGRIGIP